MSNKLWWALGGIALVATGYGLKALVDKMSQERDEADEKCEESAFAYANDEAESDTDSNAASDFGEADTSDSATQDSYARN